MLPNEKSVFSVPTLEQTIARMQSEVLADVQSGKVNAAVSGFSQLHDYVDANEYGGFWDDALLDALIQHFGGRDYNGAMPDGLMDYINAAQGAIDAWLQAGGIVERNRINRGASKMANINENATITNDKARVCVSLAAMRACLRNNNGMFGGNFAKVYATWYGGTPIGA